MTGVRSLTRDEAEARAALLEVQRYDVAVDLTGMRDGTDFRATSTIRFTARPGAETFVDCVAEVVEATLNGAPVPAELVAEDRITLRDLAADNTLVVTSVQHETGKGVGVHRAVDPADGEVYVWTTFEPDDARRAWACFDQPDLKAEFAITVTAPAAWTVLSNSGDAEVTTPGEGTRTWTFPVTPRLSTYLPVVNAGPLHEVRTERAGHDLGLYCRRSLAPMLDRDAEEIFEITAQGLAFYADRFAMPFPQRRYDQAFMPELSGAMENYGCVTWSDAFVYRDAPTFAERELRALIILHEMAHMWFGDIVTMRWWDDLWLNESFADWACAWTAEAATGFTDAWAGVLASSKVDAYAADRAPTTHPIRQPAKDVAEATASFDDITYAKGQAVLKQLVAFVGEDVFVTALRAYFAKHAWGNTTLHDLVDEVAAASGRDLTAWTKGWLELAGTDELRVEATDDGVALRATSPDGGEPRPHRLHIGAYDESGDGYTLRETRPVEVAGEVTDLGELAADLLLVNDDDLTFAAVRPDLESMRRIVDGAGGLPTAIARTVAVTTVWDMLQDDEATADDVVTCAAGVLPRESADAVVEPVLRLAIEAAELWSPPTRREELLATLADTCLTLADQPGKETVALRALAATATTDAQLEELDARATTFDVRWRRLVRLAELGRLDLAEVDALQVEDPNPDAWISAFAVRAARPDAAAKQEAWRAVSARELPAGMLRRFRSAFWRPGQAELLAPYTDRYIEALPSLHDGGMLWAMTLSYGLFPVFGADADACGRIEEAAGAPGVSPLVSHTVRERSDLLRRMLSARAGAVR